MKHAYLIMAHDNFYNLEILLKLLDYKNNDFYIHIDKKIKNFDKKYFSKLLINSSITYVEQKNIFWGTYSQIEAIKILMTEATKKHHDYYHMISGADLPIKTNEEIDIFFKKNEGKEFVGFAGRFTYNLAYKYNFFVKYFRHKNKLIALNARRCRNFLIYLQDIFNINSLKNFKMELKKGCDWYSLTHDAVLYLLEKEPEFNKYFKKAMGPGEFFVQTILYNSEFKNNIYNLDDENLGSLRFIDWKRGQPYTFTNDDFELLINSELIFARKFHENADKKIIDNIYKKLKKEF